MNHTVITIAGLPGSGSTTTAQQLSQSLNIEYFSVGRLFKDLAQGTITRQYYYPLFISLCQQHGIDLPDFHSKNDSTAAQDLWKTSLGKSAIFHNVLDLMQTKLAEKENIIIDGKLSIHMIPSANLKIWLHASLDERARRTSQRDSIPLEKALHLVTQRQETERTEWMQIYGIDSWDQRTRADIIFDTTRLTPKKILTSIQNNPKFPSPITS